MEEKITSVYCRNCRRRTHATNKCPLPICSYGVVAFRTHPSTNEHEYILVRPKFTMEYLTVMRGHYLHSSTKYITHLCRHMTMQEREKLTKGPFTQLYEESHSTHKDYEFNRAHRAYLQLVQSSPANPVVSWVDHIQLASDMQWTEPEWGFPKGRREKNESEMECAFREFHEETGIQLPPAYLIHNMAQFHEMFTGTDHQVYKHIYYMVRIPWETSGLTPLPKETEIQEARWVTFSEGMNLIRNYQHSRRILFQHIHDFTQTHPIFIL